MNPREYLFQCLIEECLEVGHIASKCLRFGHEDCHPETGEVNVQKLGDEVVDLLAILELLGEDGVAIPWKDRQDAIERKKDKVARFALVSLNLGFLEVPGGSLNSQEVQGPD